MSSEHKISVTQREAFGTGAARACRRSGMVPGVIYGLNKTPEGISLDPKDLAREIKKPGFFARVFVLNVNGNDVKALVKSVQRHPVTDVPLHVDFMRITKDTRVNVFVPVYFTGVDRAPALKRGGLLNIVNRRVEIIAPADAIPSSLTVDLSEIDLTQGVRLEHLTFPAGVEISNAKRYQTIATILKKGGKKDAADDEAAEAA